MNKVIKTCGKEVIKLLSHIYVNFAREKNRNYCNICDKEALFVRWTGADSGFTEQHQVIGMGRRNKTVCPYCNSIDRYRWLYYVLQSKKIIDNKSRVLHFAPEEAIEKKLRNMSDTYISGDIQPGRADEVVDITDIGFESDSFDVVIASMIIEHIPDEKKAIEELKRVIKKNGRIVITVPIALDISKTYEDLNTASDEERLEKFGQIDHVRIFGTDYKEHFEAFGLKVEVYKPCDILSDYEIRRMALIPQDTVLICTLP